MEVGIFSSFTQRGMSGKFKINNIKLATQKLAITAHAISPWSRKRKGPGISPFIMNAPMITATVGEPGMPRVNMGIRAAFA